MTTIPDDNSTGWRDLTYQLTENRIRRLVALQTLWQDNGKPEPTEDLLDTAREFERSNLAEQALFADLPTPYGAVTEYEPGKGLDGSGWARDFVGT